VPACPFLAEEQPPAGDPSRPVPGEAVVLSPAAWGIDPASDTVLEGPFLVGVTDPGSDSPWEIVARYDPFRSVRVVIP